MSDELPSVRLRIITPEQIVFDGPVDWAQIPLEDGLLGVWPEHSPLVASTASGELVYSIEGAVERLPVGAGVLCIDSSHCVVMYGATAASPRPERDMEALAARLEEDLFDRLSEREVDDLQQS